MTDPVLNEIKYAIFLMAPAQQVAVMEAADKLRAIVRAAGTVGQIALALVGAEAAAQ